MKKETKYIQVSRGIMKSDGTFTEEHHLSVEADVYNEFFALHKPACKEDECYGNWIVTHVLTGWIILSHRTKKGAIKLIHELAKLPIFWDFTDPTYLNTNHWQELFDFKKKMIDNGWWY